MSKSKIKIKRISENKGKSIVIEIDSTRNTYRNSVHEWASKSQQFKPRVIEDKRFKKPKYKDIY